jgi:hypothetical protein
MVALSTLDNNMWSDQEIEHIARSRWWRRTSSGHLQTARVVAKYPIAALVSNPRTRFAAACG